MKKTSEEGVASQVAALETARRPKPSQVEVSPVAMQDSRGSLEEEAAVSERKAGDFMSGNGDAAEMHGILNAHGVMSLFLKILLVVLLVEGAIMVTFNMLAVPLEGWVEASLDVLILAAVSTPLVYLLGIRPYIKRTEKAVAAAAESRAKLLALNRDLAFQKRTLDEHAIVSIADVKGNIIYANDKLCLLSGYSRVELVGRHHRILGSGHHSKAFFADMWRTIASGRSWHGEIKNKAKNGEYYWVKATIVPFLNNDGKPFQYIAVRTEITQRKLMEEALKQAQRIARIGSWSLNLTTNHLMWSDEIFKIFGIDPKRFGATLDDFFAVIHPDDLDYVKAQYKGSLAGRFPYDIEHRIIRRDTGEVRWVHEMCVHQHNDAGEVTRSDGTVQDITERKLAQDEVRRLAMTDQLTGLANRYQFHKRFGESLSLARRENKRLALLLLDLDKFKPVNDTYGHQTGDALLTNVAEIFQRHSRDTDVVARLGGDEFAVLLVHPVGVEGISAVAQRIIDAVKAHVHALGYDVRTGISIGVSQYPDDGVDQDSLIEKADLALYAAKSQGSNRFRFYGPELETHRQAL